MEHDRAKEIASARAELLARYPICWRRMIARWRADDGPDACWLQYVANYLFRTTGVRWAVDPAFLPAVFGTEDVPPTLAADLAGMSFALLTHGHGDHFCPGTLRALAGLPVRWVVPDHMLSAAVDEAGLREDRILVPEDGKAVEIDGISITAYQACHYDPAPPGAAPDERVGMPATGYLVETGSHRILLPGDVRTYDASQVPQFGPVDWVFAHLWLGRNAALMDEPPMMDAFCRFTIDLKPRAILLTHVLEVSRDPANYWTLGHARSVVRRLQEIAPDVRVVVPRIGECQPL